MQFRRVHPLAIGVVILALIVSFLCGVAYGAEPNVGEGVSSCVVLAPGCRSAQVGSTPTTAAVDASSPAPLVLTGAETAVAVRALEMQLGVWWATVSANMIAEAESERPISRVDRGAGLGDPVALSSAPSGGSSGTGDCTGYPGYVPTWRESNNQPDVVNPSSGAFGCAQLMPMHFRAGGTCADLPTSYEGQRECAWRLPASAWNL